MQRSVEEPHDETIERLYKRESLLQHELNEEQIRYSGLKDIDTVLELVAVKFELSNRLLERFDPVKQAGESGEFSQAQIIKQKCTEAVDMLEELRSMNISEDQKQLVTETESYQRIRSLFQEFVINGGAPFFESRIEDAHKLKVVARAISESISKYRPPDDRYKQAFKTENLPAVFRRLVNFFLPILAREGQQDPPFGINEGEEFLLRSEKMKMPISQAIYYLETEVLPRLERELAADPGNTYVQRQISRATTQLGEYKSVTFRPRATPLNLEKGFYTDWLSQYTADGELLVTISLPVEYKSGTNLDRLREMVKTELVRRLAGRGVCPALDEDYRFRKSLESGRRGSSRVPSFKLDIRRGFEELKTLYPNLKRLENRQSFQKLVDLVGGTTKRRAQKMIEAVIQGDSRDLLRLP